jgi:hypothetical protein
MAARDVEHVETGVRLQRGQRLAARCLHQRGALRSGAMLHRGDIMRHEDFSGQADMRQIAAHRQARRVELVHRTREGEASAQINAICLHQHA